MDKTLKTKTAPSGIVSFELSGNFSQTKQILKEWGPQGRVSAALSLGLDYLFLFVYAIFIALACVLIARYLTFRIAFLAVWGFVLGWGQFFAAILDAVENFALINLLLDSQREYWPVIARWCAIVKFGIVGTGLGYILIGTLIILTRLCLTFRKR